MSETTESEWPTVNASDLEKVINVFDMVTNKEKVSHDTNVRFGFFDFLVYLVTFWSF